MSPVLATVLMVIATVALSVVIYMSVSYMTGTGP